MIAIVQKNDIPTTGAAQALNHRLGLLSAPITCCRAPHRDACTASMPHDSIEQRAAITKKAAASSEAFGQLLPLSRHRSFAVVL